MARAMIQTMTMREKFETSAFTAMLIVALAGAIAAAQAIAG